MYDLQLLRHQCFHCIHQGCKRDVEVRDRDVWLPVRDETEIETFPLFPRSRPRRSILGPRRDRDVDRPRPRHFSRPWRVELHLNYFKNFSSRERY